MNEHRKHRPSRCLMYGMLLSILGSFGLASADPVQDRHFTDHRVTSEISQGRTIQPLNHLPPSFIENKGQTDSRVRYYAKTAYQTLWFTDEGIVFDLLRPHNKDLNNDLDARPDSVDRLIFKQRLIGAGKDMKIDALVPQSGAYNYFIGNDPGKWRTGVRGYGEVIYAEVYPGIDLRLYGKDRALEQEFVVRPGGNPEDIRVAYEGVEGMQIAGDGTLRIRTAFGEMKESPPHIYQEIAGKRVEVTGRFRLTGKSMYTFEVGPHNPQYALVIDPTLEYATYLGGTGAYPVYDLALSIDGSATVTGVTNALDFPVTGDAVQPDYAGGSWDAFVTRLSPDGSTLIFSTYLGGSSVDDGSGVAVDAQV